MRYTVLTNNPLAAEKLSGQVIYCGECSLLDVLTLARDRIHNGHRLLTHPLAGSVKPNVQPYKTVIVSAEGGCGIDCGSLEIIENAIAVTRKFLNDAGPRAWDDETLADFRLIDYSLIEKAMD